VPSTAGGAPDFVARVLAEQLSAALGQPVVVDNRRAASGVIGAEQVVAGPADGHTLLIGSDALLAIAPHLFARMTLDVERDLVVVAPIASHAFILTINPALPARTLGEFVQLARLARPPLAYASAGIGSQHHLTMERFKQRAHIDLAHIPYRGGTAAANAVVAGEVAAVFAGTSQLALIRSGRLRPVAVTGAARMAAFPDLPSLAESYPGLEMTNWIGLFAPSGTPAPVIARLRDAVSASLGTGATRKRLEEVAGLQIMTMSAAEFERKIRTDRAHYGDIVKELGLKPQ
jgi:tripartite-type tricarboxylate transporter receptor subunit TctC